MPPIRVLQVMPAMDAGGMETFVMNVYRTIDREKVQFDFLYHYDKPCFFDDEIRALGGRIFKLTVRQDNNLPRYLRELRALFAAHPEWRIIHGHYSGFGMFYNPAARRVGIPVRCGHSHNTAYERNFVGRLDHFMSSFFNIGLTDRFACSEKAWQMLFGKHPFTVVPNGIDTARFAARDPQRRALLRGELGVTDQEILFGHVGRFSDQKNHPGLLKIFAAVRTRLPKARLVLLGGGAISGLFTTRSALSFLVFTLLYTPCIAAVATIRREFNSTLKTVGVVLMQCCVAWIVAFVVYTLVGIL